MQKQIIFNLIENYEKDKNHDLIDYVKKNPYCLRETFNCFNVFTYSAQFSNDALQKIIDLIYSQYIDIDVDIESEDFNGNNALHISCLNYKFNNTKFLLEKGFDPNCINKQEKTPLILLIEKISLLKNVEI